MISSLIYWCNITSIYTLDNDIDVRLKYTFLGNKLLANIRMFISEDDISNWYELYDRFM